MQPSVDTKRITGSTETHDAIAKGIVKEVMARYEKVEPMAEYLNRNNESWYKLTWSGLRRKQGYNRLRRRLFLTQELIAIYDGKIHIGIRVPDNTNYLCYLADPDFIDIVKNHINKIHPRRKIAKLLRM